MKKAARHLSAHDPVLKPVVQQVGLCRIRPHRNYYQELVESIISQQLSIKAADTIFGRFKDLFGGKFPAPAKILVTEHDAMRGVGLSNAKARYVKDLAQHIVDGELELEKFDVLSNAEITVELTAVKGIGEWTAHMFLMFAMARLDVLAVGDLGIRAGIQELYGLKTLPDAKKIEVIAKKNQWHPYETVACWYVWHRAEENK